MPRTLTADEVLAFIVDMHRQQAQFDEMVDRDAVLTFDTTVRAWRAACDLVGSCSLGPALNAWFGTSYSREQWMHVLTPEKERTLRVVCDFVAAQALAP